jgi:hypothetical protein
MELSMRSVKERFEVVAAGACGVGREAAWKEFPAFMKASRTSPCQCMDRGNASPKSFTQIVYFRQVKTDAETMTLVAGIISACQASLRISDYGCPFGSPRQFFSVGVRAAMRPGTVGHVVKGVVARASEF